MPRMATMAKNRRTEMVQAAPEAIVKASALIARVMGREARTHHR